MLFKISKILFVDSCGIGGDGLNIINISIIVVIVVVVVGINMVKYGNCSVLSNFGLVDLLKVLGINIDMSFE